MSALEELRGGSPALRSGFVPEPPEDWQSSLVGLLAARRAEAVARAGELAVSEDDKVERSQRAEARFAAPPDLEWLRVLHVEHEGVVAAFEAAAAEVRVLQARREAGREEYAALLRVAVAEGRETLPSFDQVRADVEVELAQGRLGAAGGELARTAQVTVAALARGRRVLFDVARAVEECAPPGSSDWSRMRGHRFVSRAGAMTSALAVPQNFDAAIARFRDASQELAVYSSASARRQVLSVVAHV